MENVENIETSNPSVDDSILSSIKKMLGITPDYEQFDLDIKVHINTAFAALTQIGVGPKEGFRITGKDEVWTDYTERQILIDPIKDYIYSRVRLVFDPPTSSMVTEAVKETIRELEWRIQVSVEFNKKEETQNGD